MDVTLGLWVMIAALLVASVWGIIWRGPRQKGE